MTFEKEESDHKAAETAAMLGKNRREEPFRASACMSDLVLPLPSYNETKSKSKSGNWPKRKASIKAL